MEVKILILLPRPVLQKYLLRSLRSKILLVVRPIHYELRLLRLIATPGDGSPQIRILVQQDILLDFVAILAEVEGGVEGVERPKRGPDSEFIFVLVRETKFLGLYH